MRGWQRRLFCLHHFLTEKWREGRPGEGRGLRRAKVKEVLCRLPPRALTSLLPARTRCARLPALSCLALYRLPRLRALPAYRLSAASARRHLRACLARLPPRTAHHAASLAPVCLLLRATPPLRPAMLYQHAQADTFISCAYGIIDAIARRAASLPAAYAKTAARHALARAMYGAYDAYSGM